MTSYRVRPRFHRISSLPASVIGQNFTNYLQNTNNCEGIVNTQSVVLKIPPAEQHFWSPQLSISLEENPEGSTTLRGVYGPKPAIWTMFAFAYAANGILAIFALLLGMTRWSLGLGSTFLWVFIVLLVMLGVLYLIAQFGQKLGVEQTFTLHHIFEEVMHEKVHIE